MSLENGMDKANQPTRQHNVINSLYTPLWLWLWPWLWLWLRLSGSGSGPGSSSGSGSSRALQQTFHRWPFQKLKIRNAYVFCIFPKCFSVPSHLITFLLRPDLKCMIVSRRGLQLNIVSNEICTNWILFWAGKKRKLEVSSPRRDWKWIWNHNN